MSRTRIVSIVTFLLLFAVSSYAQTNGNQVAKGPTPKASAPTATSTSKSSNVSLVDLNTASLQTLMTLPGISDVSAQKIIENRPYKSKTDLTQKKVISVDAYSKIETRIVARTTTKVNAGNAEKKAANSKGTSEVTKKYQ
jgi:competence protein ComEA